MLGPYDSMARWDYLTHFVSAAFVAAVVYGGLVVVLDAGGRINPVAVTVLATLVVVWELLELVDRAVVECLDVPPVPVVYGWRATVVDLDVDGLAAFVVVLAGFRAFVPVFEQVPDVQAAVVAGGGLILYMGVVLAAALVTLDGIPEIEWS